MMILLNVEVVVVITDEGDNGDNMGVKRRSIYENPQQICVQDNTEMTTRQITFSKATYDYQKHQSTLY